MTKKELCKRLTLQRPWLLDQWIACGKMKAPVVDASKKRVYTEEHYKVAVKLLEDIQS